MKNDWLEKGLKNKLGNQGSPMDLEDAWNALESKRKKEKTKRRFFVWWFSGGLLLIAALGYMALSTDNFDLSQSNQTENSFTNQTAQHSTIDNQATTKGQSNSIDNTLDATAPAIDLKASANANDEFTISSTKNSIQGTTYNQLKSSITQFKNTSLEAIYTAPSYTSSPIQQATNELPRAGISETLSTANIDKKGLSLLLPLTLKTAELLSTTKRSLEIDFPQLANYTTKRVRPTSKKPLTQYIGLATGYGLRAQGKIFAKETPIDAISLQLFYQRSLTKNLYLKTGVNLDQHTNKIKATTTNKGTEALDNQIIVVNNYQDGRQDKISGTTEVEILQTASYTIYNRYQHVSIPLILGLEWALGGKSNLQVEGGLSASLASRYDIKDIAFGNTTSISPLENLELNHFGLLQGLYGLSWSYFPFAKREIGFFASVRGQFQLNDISGVEELNIERFRGHQLMLGVKRRMR